MLCNEVFEHDRENDLLLVSFGRQRKFEYPFAHTPPKELPAAITPNAKARFLKNQVPIEFIAG